MASDELFMDWTSSEKMACDYAKRAAQWVSQSWVEKSKLFEVAFESGREFPNQTNPNAASNVIGLIWERMRTRPWQLSMEIEWRDLESKIILQQESIAKGSAQSLLPLKTFGVLPLFSTAYIAQYLPICITDIKVLAKSRAYAVALRRILVDVYALCASSRTDVSSPQSVLHPYLMCQLARGLRSFLHAFRGDKVQTTELIAKLNDADWLNTDLGVDLSEALLLHNEPFAMFVAELSDSTLRVGLAAIEERAMTAVLLELAKHGRANGRSVDPSSLAFAMLVLAEANSERHSALLSQGLPVLLESSHHGVFPAGMPFYSDSKGRALFVPSIETANAIIGLCMARLDKLQECELEQVVAATTKIQDRLTEEYNCIEVHTPSNELICGWCSDRAPSPTRVDSWISAHVLEFFLGRVNLLRWVKRNHVLSQYSWVSHRQCSPSWDDLQCPDLGHISPGAKERIWRVLEEPPHKRSVAPTFLLYGPPGTSKTTFVQAVASQKKWDLISLSPSDFIADSLDRIELRSRKIFNDLMNIDKCVVLMDEMDSLLRDRGEVQRSSPGTIIEFVIPAFLPKLQQLRDYALQKDMAIFFATNYYESLDKAISRPGRMDNHIPVLPYSADARELVAKNLWKRARGDSDIWHEFRNFLASLPCNLVFRDVEMLVRQAVTSPRFDEASLRQISERLGVSPETYRSRSGALREFTMMAARLTSTDYSENIPPADQLKKIHWGAAAEWSNVCASINV